MDPEWFETGLDLCKDVVKERWHSMASSELTREIVTQVILWFLVCFVRLFNLFIDSSNWSFVSRLCHMWISTFRPLYCWSSTDYGVDWQCINKSSALGWVARSMVSANHWLRGIKTYRLSWYLTRVIANHASSNWALVDGDKCILILSLVVNDWKISIGGHCLDYTLVPQGSVVALISCCVVLFDRMHPSLWNFNSIIPIGFVRLKSYVIK